MQVFYAVIIVIAIAVILYLFYLLYKEEKRKRNEKHLANINAYLPNIYTATTQMLTRLTNYDMGYFTNYEFTNWINSFSRLYEIIKDNNYDDIGLEVEDDVIIKSFKNYFENGSQHRNFYNQDFLKKELKKYDLYFNDIEGRKLDLQQRTAIITDEDNNIVIAGAGSGKTTTIVGKVTYVINRYKIPADQILLISFTKKSALELSKRIPITGVEAKTFHKFGKDVITETEQRQPSLFDENQYESLITGFFKELMKDRQYLNKVTSYFTNFLKTVKSQDEFKNHGEYIQYLKDLNFSTYKTKSIQFKNRTTLKREIVKSIEECSIANFLFFNGVEYEYELPYKHETATKTVRQYKPDFTINPRGEAIYLEHFGINKDGKVPHFFADKEKGQTIEKATQEYLDGVKWKKEIHSRYGTKLIETYSHEMFDNILFENLKNKLADAGIQLRPKTPEETWEIISEAAKDEVDGFITLIQTFITLMKSNNYSIEDVKSRNNEVKGNFQRQRNILFLEIIDPIYEKYQRYLENRKEIDFSDMINKASSYIFSGKYKRKFSYVIVDEFQDISIGRYQLVKAIKETNPSCKLFCVGDDWQSIYRFSGSDIALFKDFDKYFGYSEKSKIETTYRFSNPLIDSSSKFILKNPNQSNKQLRSINNGKSSFYKIVYSVSENQDDTYALKDILDELLLSGKAKEKKVLVLGRYTFDINRIRNDENIFYIDKQNETISYSKKIKDGDTLRLSAQFMTVHKSKGLEADYVIVINCNSGKQGFPSEMSDDKVLNLLLSEADQFENGEERRLFYVAMTRAKEMVYFVADSANKSKFISELEVESKSPEIKKCPKCKTADLVKKSGVKDGKEWAFYGCSNFIYGCEFKEWIT